MAPKSILKKRPPPSAAEDAVVEVPAGGDVAPEGPELPEEESDSDEDDQDGSGDSDEFDAGSDEEGPSDDDEDEDDIREMGADGKAKPKSTFLLDLRLGCFAVRLRS